MISFEEARRAIREQAVQLRTIQIPLAGSLGHYTASAISSLSDSPRFTNSAVDGYAFHFEPGQRTYKLVGSVAAGEFFDRKLIRGECVRIFTGAMLPDGADTCVMQEYVEAGETTVTHSDASLKEGSNVRFRGEELSVGDALIPKGVFLNAQGIGLLAACGVDQVHVYAKPKVKVIVTGSEFIERTAEKGRIFNSNGPMLSASFAQLGYEVHVAQVRDDKSTLKQIIAESLDTADLVVTTGGVSVGDHDHVVPICDEIGLEKVFHGVAQKPGKPMYFGKGQGKHLLGLPGNPARGNGRIPCACSTLDSGDARDHFRGSRTAGSFGS